MPTGDSYNLCLSKVIDYLILLTYIVTPISIYVPTLAAILRSLGRLCVT